MIRRTLAGVAAGLILVAAMSIPAVGHHKPNHRGGPPTTTTTAATTTSTSTTQPPTTTSASTTTTQAPTTTAPAGEIPATVPSPDIRDSCSGEQVCANGYEVNIGRQLDDDTGFEGTFWKAPYVGKGGIERDAGVDLPYAPGFQWVNGDRIAYECMYGFVGPSDMTILEVEDRAVGRFTAIGVRNPDAPGALGYALISDSYMVEGDFFWTGEFTDGYSVGNNNDGQAYTTGWCRTTANSQPYEFNFEPGQLPRIAFWVPGNPKPVEVRDYREVVLGDAGQGGHFRADVIAGPFPSSDGQGREITVTSRVRVRFYDSTGEPKVIFYYDGMNGGYMTLDFP